MFQLKKATRKQVKIKVGLQGPAGSGKTLGALIAAFGITKDWEKIAFIDTENESASLYANRYFDTIDFSVGEFQTIKLDPPFTPERYVEAMQAANVEGIEVVIVDSMSHEWNGKGGILDLHEQMGKMNDMQKWAKLTPRHNTFVDAILRYPKHMFICLRSKQDYVMKEGTNAAGRNIVIPEKVGLKAVTKDGVDYEFTLNFEIDINNFAHVSKDRTGLFKGKPEFKITTDIGQKIKDWCDLGVDEIESKAAELLAANAKLNACENLPKLRIAYGELSHELKAATATLKDELKAKFEAAVKPADTPAPDSLDAEHIASAIAGLKLCDTVEDLVNHKKTLAAFIISDADFIAAATEKYNFITAEKPAITS